MKKNKDEGTPHKWKIAIGIMLVLVLIRVVASLPLVRFGNDTITLFSADRLVAPLPSLNRRPMEQFWGRVLGNHVLETEHGDITLVNFPRVEVQRNIVTRISAENFKEGRVTHNLVIDGIEIPPNIAVGFRNSQISSLRLDRQEVVISGSTFIVGTIFINSPRDAADIVIEAGLLTLDQVITLADSTQIRRGERSARTLHMYREAKQWRIQDSFPFLVKLPGETEFIRYSSITFRPNWGEFIGGIRFD